MNAWKGWIPVRLNNLDLNLLIALDVLLAERNVTRAAERLRITQSAMSNALRRLRTYFDDPLFVHIGRRMELTPKAEAMHHSVRDIIVRIESTVASDVRFDPSQTTKQFRILVSDYSLTVLMPTVFALASSQGCRARFQLLPQTELPSALIERGEADIIVAPKQILSGDHPREVLFEDSYVCIAWKKGRYGKARLTRSQYLQAGHVRMIAPESAKTNDMESLEDRGIDRNVEVTCYSFAALPHLVAGTDRLATVHRLTATEAAKSLPIVCHEVPFPMDPLQQYIQWHDYRGRDPAILWLRQLFRKAVDIVQPRSVRVGRRKH